MGVFVRAVLGWYRRRARRAAIAVGSPAAWIAAQGCPTSG
jgi:hypothetical protein